MIWLAMIGVDFDALNYAIFILVYKCKTYRGSKFELSMTKNQHKKFDVKIVDILIFNVYLLCKISCCGSISIYLLVYYHMHSRCNEA